MLNCLPVEQGACVRRPGTQFAYPTRKGQPGRTIRFDFKQTEPYLIEFTSGFLRFRKGPTLVTTNDDLAVVSISTANPAKVLTAAHGWATGNAVKFANLGATCPLLQNRIFTITVTSSTQFTLVDEITGATVDGSTLGVGSLAATATVQRIRELASPYTGVLWQDVRVVPSELQAVMLHPKNAPYVLTAVPPVGTQTFFSFTLAKAPLLNGPYLDPPTNGARLTPSGTTGIITLTLSFRAWSNLQAYSVGDFVTYAGNNNNYQSLQDQNQNAIPSTSPLFWKPVSAGLAIGPNGFVGTDVGRLIRLFNSNWTYGKIVSVANLINTGLGVAFGTMSGSGGLNAAFDSVTSKAFAASATGNSLGTDPSTFLVGKNYSGTPQAVGSVTVWAPNDLFLNATKSYNVSTTPYSNSGGQWVAGVTTVQNVTVPMTANQVIFNLRANTVAPTNPSDGTLLGQFLGLPGAGTNFTIVSNNQASTWNFVWIEVFVSQLDASVPANFDGRVPNPPLPSSIDTVTQTFALTSFQVSVGTAQLQLFNPAGTAAGNAVSFQLFDALPNTLPMDTWRLGAYGDTGGWPTCGTYHEGRLWLSGAIPNRFDGSVSNSIFEFTPTLATGPVLDSSAITATFNAPDVNAIFWMVPDQLGIIVGTQAGDWLVQASNNNNPLTPTSIQAHRYSKLGCANIEPHRMDRVLILVQRFQRKLYEYFADVYSGKFTAQNITWALRQLTKSGIAELAVQQELAPIIWVRCTDGSWFGITYKRESIQSSQPPNFAAGHRHLLGSGRTVESITVSPSIDGTLDSLAMVTNDPSSNIRHVEILTSIFEEGTAETAAWFLDDAVTPSSTTTSDTTPAPYGGMTMNGLWHLNGRTVTVFAGGIDCGDFTVANGSITVPYGDGISGGTGGGLFTAAFATTATIVVGFTYTTRGQIVRPVTPQESGSRSGPALGKKRRTQEIAALLDNTAGISFGTDFNKLRPALFRSENGTPYATGQMFSGIHANMKINDDSGYDSMICWECTRPYSATVVAIEGFLSSSEK